MALNWANAIVAHSWASPPTLLAFGCEPLGLDDVGRVGASLRRRLAVVAPRSIATLDCRAHTLVGGGADELQSVGGVAHQPVEDAAERLGGRQTHVLVGLIDDELLSLQLGQRDVGKFGGHFGDTCLEVLERNGLVDEFYCGGFFPVSGSPVNECHFTFASDSR